MTREEEILAKIVARYERAKKENGSKVTCAVSRLSTPKERKERHQGFLAGLLTAEGICREVIETSVINPWHKASEELPKEGQHILVAHKMRTGDYMTEAIWYPEPSITDNMEYWMEIPEIPEYETL